MRQPPMLTRMINGRSTLRLTANFSTPGNQVHTVKLSPDGDYLAIGNDHGRLEIRLLDGRTWSAIAVHFTGAAIRALTWHPVMARTIFVGSANGFIHRITVVIGGDNVIFHDTLAEYVHTMAISPDGRQLAIGYGQRISLINDPFPETNFIGTFLPVPIPQYDDSRIIDCMIPVGIFFVDDNHFAVTFFGRCGICVFSRSDMSLLSIITLREGSLIGSSALSPSGERMAIMNLRDGIDWYSLSHNCYISTTTYAVTSSQAPHNLIVDLAFIDEDTVAVGNVNGSIFVATYGVPEVKLSLKVDRISHVPLQTLTFGLSSGRPMIFTVLPRVSPAGRRRQSDSSLVSMCVIEGPPGMGIVPGVATNTVSDMQRKIFHRLTIYGTTLPAVVPVLAITLLAILLGTNAVFFGKATVVEGNNAVQKGLHATETPQTVPLSAPSSKPGVSTCICTLSGTMTVINSPTSVADTYRV